MKNEEVLEMAKEIIEGGIKALKPVKIPKFKIKAGEEDEEVMVALLSDCQVGIKTDTFNAKVFTERLNRYKDRILLFAHLHRKVYPIRVLKVMILGDVVQNDLIKRFIDLAELEMIVADQVVVATEEISQFLIDLLPHFEKVEVHAVSGNHGQVHKFAATQTNWDWVIYKLISERLRKQPRLKFNITDKWYNQVKIHKWIFTLIHGDGIRRYMNVPWYSIERMCYRWQSALPKPSNYYLFGHNHNFINWDCEGFEVFANGTFLSDCEYARKNVARTGSLSQIVFGVHPKKGATFRYKAYLEDKK